MICRKRFQSTSPENFCRGDVLSPLARYTRINWPPNKDSMINLDPKTETLVLSDDFESWARDINNWSLDFVVVAKYPAFANRAWINGNGATGGFREDIRAF